METKKTTNNGELKQSGFFLLIVTHEYKINTIQQTGDWESCQSKYDNIRANKLLTRTSFGERFHNVHWS